MAKIQRPQVNVTPFASRAAEGERAAFGTDTDTTDISQHINPDYLRGFKSVYGPEDVPEKRDFNGINFAAGVMTAYLYQSGIPEWNDNQEYHFGSIARFNNAVFVSKTDDNIGNNPLGDNGGLEWTLENSVGLPISDVSSVIALDNNYAVCVDTESGYGHVLSTIDNNLAVVNYDGFLVDLEGVDPDGIKVNSLIDRERIQSGGGTNSYTLSPSRDKRFGLVCDSVQGSSTITFRRFDTNNDFVGSYYTEQSSNVRTGMNAIQVDGGKFFVAHTSPTASPIRHAIVDISKDFIDSSPASIIISEGDFGTDETIYSPDNHEVCMAYNDGWLILINQTRKSLFVNSVQFDYTNFSKFTPSGLFSLYLICDVTFYNGDIFACITSSENGSSGGIYSIDKQELFNNSNLVITKTASISNFSGVDFTFTNTAFFKDNGSYFINSINLNSSSVIRYGESPYSDSSDIYTAQSDNVRMCDLQGTEDQVLLTGFGDIGGSPGALITIDSEGNTYGISTQAGAISTAYIAENKKVYLSNPTNIAQPGVGIYESDGSLTGIPPEHISMCSSGTDRFFITNGSEIQCYEVSKSNGTAQAIGSGYSLETNTAGDIGGVNVEICYLSGENMPSPNSDYIILYSDRAQKLVCLEFDGLGFSVFNGEIAANVGNSWSQVSNTSRDASSFLFNNRSEGNIYLYEATAGGVFSLSNVMSNNIAGLTNPIISEGVGNKFLAYDNVVDNVVELELDGTILEATGFDIATDSSSIVRAIIVDDEKRILSDKDSDLYTLYSNVFVPRESDNWRLLSSNGVDVNIGTLPFVGKTLNEAIKAIATEVKYFVGCIYESVLPDSPADILGFGIWQRIEGRYLFATSDTDPDFAAGVVGGSKTHEHTSALNLQEKRMNVIIPRDGWGVENELFPNGLRLPSPSVDGRLVTGSGWNERAEDLESLAHASLNRNRITDGHTHGIGTSSVGSLNLPPSKGVYTWTRIG